MAADECIYVYVCKSVQRESHSFSAIKKSVRIREKTSSTFLPTSSVMCDCRRMVSDDVRMR